jgi:hypothetical protein
VRVGSTAARARADLAFLRADYFLDLPDFLQRSQLAWSVSHPDPRMTVYSSSLSLFF